MLRQKHLTFYTLAAAVFMTLACSHAPTTADVKKSDSESMVKTAKAAAAVGGGEYVVIQFSKGIRDLSTADKRKLRSLAAGAPEHGKIAKFEVLAWADREYPTDGQKATSRESKLAEDRASNISNYLKNDLSTTETVDSHNMAKRPGMFSEVFKSNDYKLKNTFEETGAAPGDHDSALAKLESKASKAVVLVKYE